MAGINDILNGSQLIVKVGTSVVAFATSCSLSFTANTTDVATKEFGKYPGKIIQSVDWEVTTENLCSATNFTDALTLLRTQVANNTPVQIAVGKVSDTDWHNGAGTVTGQSTGNITIGSYTDSPATEWFTGSAWITSLNANGAVGDNATMSVTFTGCGALEGTPTPTTNTTTEP